jgi:isoquinoline 1-oxidoreductase beta subunit
MKKKSFSRRDFIKLAGMGTGALVLAIYLDGCAPGTEAPVTVFPTLTQPAPLTPTEAATESATQTPTPEPTFTWTPDLYVKLDNNGVLTVTACRSEMGQGVRTALAMLTADELDVAWNNVRIEQANADSRYGDQSTGGSQSISSFYGIMRKAGAKARKMLMDAAAQTWNVSAAKCTTEPGFVIHPDGTQKLAYGALVEKASAMNLPATATLKDQANFHIIRTAVGHWDAPNIVTGKAVYGIDVRVPGMLFAAIARCPVFNKGYTSYDDSAAKAVTGVRQVVELKNSIAVVADNSWAAIQGRDALKVTWNTGSTDSLNSATFIQLARNDLPQEGSAPMGLIDAIYTIPYEAHATMEPMNCTAYYHDNSCEVWAPTQSAQDVQGAVTNAVGLARSKVTVHVPLMGGGFGRRLQTDYADEAARVSKAIGAPVQVVWTRDDDIQHDFYHSMRLQYFQGTPDRIRVPSAHSAKNANSPVPTGAWRSVGNFPEAYGVQCFLDELAAAAKRDPLDVWLEVYSGRAAAVIKLAAEKAGWGSALATGQGRGLAYHATFGLTHVAMVAEVTVNNGDVRVMRVVCAVDCGKIVNPDNIAAQMEGGVAFGLTAALKAQVTIKDGRVEQGNFDDYPLVRMDEMPVVETYIIETDNSPTGIGEMGVPPVAPAVANAIFAATGKRVRQIPILPQTLS